MAQRRSRQDLLAFLDYCKEKGLLKAPTAEARKAAVNQVLGILSEDEAQDVSAIDLDAVVARFHNMHGKRYTPDSLKTYKARVKGAIADFLNYLANPMEFRPRILVSNKRLKTSRPITPLNDKNTQREQEADNARATPVRTTSPQPLGTSTFPIPLRSDLTVLVHGIPFDLTESEAKKIANVITAMASPA